MKQALKIILWPLACLYGLVVRARNYGYDKGLFQSTQPQEFTICVGNIAVGGTGKSPMVEYLASHLSKTGPTAILSRGYGRTTRGFIQIKEQHSAAEVGDEPLQFFKKFAKQLAVFVGEDRVKAYFNIKEILPRLKLLILDDAFQHRAIRAHLNIVMMDYNRLANQDTLLPAGRLREPIEGLTRAHILVVNKCPATLQIADKERIKNIFSKYLQPEASIYFSTIAYGKPQLFSGKATPKLENVLLVSGLANPTSFEQYCRQHFSVSRVLQYPDHHRYGPSDIAHIQHLMKDCDSLICTEKDFVKLQWQFNEAISAYYLPIQVDFMGNDHSFLSTIEQQISNFQISSSASSIK